MSNLNTQFYTNSYKKHGISAKGVHWNSKETQYLRFEVITKLIKDIKNSTLIDVGCGFADYLDYLKNSKLEPLKYLGLDCEEFMIDIASKKYQANDFLLCDILKQAIPKADYLVCSGAFNLLNERDFLFAIEKCFEASNKAFIFNFLTNKSFHELSQEDIFFYCKELSFKVTIVEEYLFNDSTILIEK